MILTTCDSAYLPEARALIQSCTRFAPEHEFYLYLVNGDPQLAAQAQSWHPRLSVETAAWPYDAARWRELMCCARTGPISQLLAARQEKLLYLDADTLVRRPLDPLFALLDQSDLTVKHRPMLDVPGAAGTLFAARFNSGVIGLRPSAAGIRFARHYDQLVQTFIASGRPLGHFSAAHKIASVIDQELLYVAYQDLAAELVFTPLPAGYNDARFNPASAIWHGKGTARRHPLYRLERLRFLIPALYHPLAPVVWLLQAARAARERLRAP